MSYIPAVTSANFTEENANGDKQYTHVLNDGSVLFIVEEQDENVWLSVQHECSESDFEDGKFQDTNGTIAMYDCDDLLQLNQLLQEVFADKW